jgi:hypothetical protein
MACACYPSYVGGVEKEDCNPRLIQSKIWTLLEKSLKPIGWGLAQVVEHLSALSGPEFKL